MLEHRFAKAVAFATFVLLVIGGTVNATGSSLACPEPTFVCNGELFPAMTGGVFYEHGHRLVAETVGILQLILSVLLWRRRPDLRWLAGLLLAMIAIQATLGAITVATKLPWYVSTGHLLLGMSYFATLIYTAFRTAPPTSVVALDQKARRRRELGPARTWIVVACSAVFLQLLVGALVRHLGAALVCLGMPTCTLGGDWWPDASVQQLHMIHRVVGVLVGIVTTVAAVQVWRHARNWPRLRIVAILAPLLVLAQIGLGILTVMSRRDVPLAVGHFAGATSLWALWISAWLMTRPPSAAREEILLAPEAVT
ncbi:MAG: COX15/CtaA family protein [Deltaproteobacteria bacterium]|nr:COX15/CtaA family protein [Deltaproteobacteria bacterium]MCW5800999.1 COX15/CtaA family protein [Deltaproteobacteria bacterium]